MSVNLLESFGSWEETETDFENTPMNNFKAENSRF